MAEREIDAIRALLTGKPRPVGWAARRERLDEVGAAWLVAGDVTLEAVNAGGPPGEVSIVPGGDPSKVLLIFHGGGYCSGSIVSHRRMVTEAGRACGARTLAVGYRLAPEHPFPAALDDALAAWRFLRADGIEAARILVGGDSAGAGIDAGAHAKAARCGRGASGRRMAGLAVDRPDDVRRHSREQGPVDPLIHKPYLEELASAYVPAGMDRRDPLISPLFANLAGLPPLLVQVASEETLLGDATRFAQAAGAAQVSVTLEVWPHMIHAWPVWNAGLEAGRQALAHLGAWVRGRH